MIESYLKSKKILIVDDEKAIIELLLTILKDNGFFNTITALSQKEALSILESEKVDLIVLDIMLSDGNGFNLLKSLRNFTNIPVIFLTAKEDISDKYMGFDLGCDDYITKPFIPREFILRLSAVLKRSYKDNCLIKLKNCTVDLSNARVIKNDEIIPLTAKEHDILDVLNRNSNYIVTIDDILDAVWGVNSFGYENSLITHIRRIREKIEKKPSNPESLVTVRGLGYRLNTVKEK